MAPAVTQNKMGEYPVRKIVPAVTTMQPVASVKTDMQPAVTSMRPAVTSMQPAVTTMQPKPLTTTMDMPVKGLSKGLDENPAEGLQDLVVKGQGKKGMGKEPEEDQAPPRYKVNFKDFGPQWQSLQNKFGQAEAVSGKSMSDDMKSAFVEEALNVGSTKAIEAVNQARQRRQKEEEMNIQYEMLQVQRDLLNKEPEDGGSVICTELHRQHLISDKLYFLDSVYGRLYVEPEVMASYQILAAPVVRLMRRSRVATFIVKCAVSPVVHTMASRLSNDFAPSTVGSVLLRIGIWCCKLYDTGRIIFDAKGRLSCKG